MTAAIKTLALALALSACVSGYAHAQEGDTYGAAPAMANAPVITLSQAVGQWKSDTVKIRLKSVVNEVCQKKGCWMILADGSSTVRVTFKDYEFFVPKDIAGRSVVVEGTLQKTVLTQDEARHYAEDAGKSKAEIESIVGDQAEYEFVAESVIVIK